MVGDLNADDFLCRVVAENTKSTVVNVDYRLAPEHKWPAQLDDSMKIYKWVSIDSSTLTSHRANCNIRPWKMLQRSMATLTRSILLEAVSEEVLLSKLLTKSCVMIS